MHQVLDPAANLAMPVYATTMACVCALTTPACARATNTIPMKMACCVRGCTRSFSQKREVYMIGAQTKGVNFSLQTS